MRSIERLYEECRELGMVSSQRAFSGLWGKQPSWFSSSLARKRIPTVDSLVAFYIRLDKIAAATREERVATKDNEEIEALNGGLEEIENIRSELWAEIQKRSESIVADRP